MLILKVYRYTQWEINEYDFPNCEILIDDAKAGTITTYEEYLEKVGRRY